MNWQQMIEFCLEANPNRGEPYIRPFINRALNEFARKTKMLKGSTTAVMDTDTVTWSLPSDCIQIDLVTYNTEGDGLQRSIYRSGRHKYNLYDGKYTYWIEGLTMYVGYIEDQDLIGVDGTFTIYYTKGFTLLTSGTDLSTDSDVPLEFRRGICARVREDLVGDMQVRGVENAIWRDTIRDGIRYAQHNHDASSLKVLIHEL